MGRLFLLGSTAGTRPGRTRIIGCCIKLVDSSSLLSHHSTIIHLVNEVTRSRAHLTTPDTPPLFHRGIALGQKKATVGPQRRCACDKAGRHPVKRNGTERYRCYTAADNRSRVIRRGSSWITTTRQARCGHAVFLCLLLLSITQNRRPAGARLMLSRSSWVLQAPQPHPTPIDRRSQDRLTPAREAARWPMLLTATAPAWTSGRPSLSSSSSSSDACAASSSSDWFLLPCSISAVAARQA